MNNEDTRAAEDDARSTLDEIEGRRDKVLTLRLRHCTQMQIAQALQVDQSTVSRDLAWIRQHWTEKFGTPASLDPSAEIGEAIALFGEVEMQALRDFSKLKVTESRARNAYLRTALIARQMRINLLQDLGFIDREIRSTGRMLRADAVRQALRDHGVLVTDGQHVAQDRGGIDVERAPREPGNAVGDFAACSGSCPPHQLGSWVQGAK